MKFIIFVLSLILFSCSLPAQASSCNNYKGHEICIFSMKPNGNRNWNYRVDLSLDGERRPTEIYNCRKQFRVQNDGKIVQFSKEDPGNFICASYKK